MTKHFGRLAVVGVLAAMALGSAGCAYDDFGSYDQGYGRHDNHRGEQGRGDRGGRGGEWRGNDDRGRGDHRGDRGDRGGRGEGRGRGDGGHRRGGH